MHPGTESLLSYRDDEPLDAGLREHIASCPQCQDSLRGLRAMRTALQQLPPLPASQQLQQPPAARLDASSRRTSRPWYALLGGLAASVLTAITTTWLLSGSPPPADSATLAPAASTQRSAAADNRAQVQALIARSQQLEAALRSLPGPPALARASTASTVVTLQNQLRLVDYSLSDGSGELSPLQQERLWRSRVALMDSLVNLRYAQYRRVSL